MRFQNGRPIYTKAMLAAVITTLLTASLVYLFFVVVFSVFVCVCLSGSPQSRDPNRVHQNKRMGNFGRSKSSTRRDECDVNKECVGMGIMHLASMFR